jgi:hypothetical protein
MVLDTTLKVLLRDQSAGNFGSCPVTLNHAYERASTYTIVNHAGDAQLASKLYVRHQYKFGFEFNCSIDVMGQILTNCDNQ